MALSKTQWGLTYVAQGTSPTEAAARAGVAASTLRVAIARAKGKEMCPCCRQVVRAGFVASDALAVQERNRLADMLMGARRETANDEVADILTVLANRLRSPT